MNTCEAYQEMISAYIDNELADADTSKLFYHLGECRECRTTLNDMLQLRTALFEVEQSSVKNATPSLWKRRLSVSYPIAAVIVMFMLISMATFFLQIFFRQDISQPARVEYVSSTPLPTVFVIETVQDQTKIQ